MERGVKGKRDVVILKKKKKVQGVESAGNVSCLSCFQCKGKGELSGKSGLVIFTDTRLLLNRARRHRRLEIPTHHLRIYCETTAIAEGTSAAVIKSAGNTRNPHVLSAVGRLCSSSWAAKSWFSADMDSASMGLRGLN